MGWVDGSHLGLVARQINGVARRDGSASRAWADHQHRRRAAIESLFSLPRLTSLSPVTHHRQVCVSVFARRSSSITACTSSLALVNSLAIMRISIAGRVGFLWLVQ